MGKDSHQSPGLADLFDAGLEDRLNRPTGEGSALPNAAYTSGEFYRLEQRSVFHRNWVFAAFKHELSGKGTALPVDVAGQPSPESVVEHLAAGEGGIAAVLEVPLHRRNVPEGRQLLVLRAELVAAVRGGRHSRHDADSGR